jgi:hypothetical protein
MGMTKLGMTAANPDLTFKIYTQFTVEARKLVACMQVLV